MSRLCSCLIVSSVSIVNPNRGPARLSALATGGTPGDGWIVDGAAAKRPDDANVDGCSTDCANSGVLTPSRTMTPAMRFIRNLRLVTYAAPAVESCEDC